MESLNTIDAPFQEAIQYLSKIDSDWERHIALIGPCLHQTQPRREPYEALVRAVAYQQLHAKAGNAIIARFLDIYNGNFPTPAEILATDISILRACGFSGRKVETIRGIAEGAISGLVPARSIAFDMHDDDLIKNLVSLKGVGRWTVEIFLMHSLERGDVLPAHDFGVREGYRKLKDLTDIPTPKAMAEIAKAWSPHRTIASWYLWRAADK